MTICEKCGTELTTELETPDKLETPDNIKFITGHCSECCSTIILEICD